jgi:predicted transposase/invertase (TIGR01784 family)
VYLLPNQLRMGIVIIEQLADLPEHLWLKMLGNRESARRAFRSIEQLSTPDRTGKNDIMAACLKYCVYLKDLAVESLTTEESEFMKTMEEIDVWYETQMNQAELKGKLEGEQIQKQSIALKMLGKNIPLETITEITGLTIEQLQQLQSSQNNS